MLQFYLLFACTILLALFGYSRGTTSGAPDCSIVCVSESTEGALLRETAHNTVSCLARHDMALATQYRKSAASHTALHIGALLQQPARRSAQHCLICASGARTDDRYSTRHRFQDRDTQ